MADVRSAVHMGAHVIEVAHLDGPHLDESRDGIAGVGMWLID
jgi:hypothetical protein